MTLNPLDQRLESASSSPCGGGDQRRGDLHQWTTHQAICHYLAHYQNQAPIKTSLNPSCPNSPGPYCVVSIIDHWTRDQREAAEWPDESGRVNLATQTLISDHCSAVGQVTRVVSGKSHYKQSISSGKSHKQPISSGKSQTANIIRKVSLQTANIIRKVSLQTANIIRKVSLQTANIIRKVSQTANIIRKVSLQTANIIRKVSQTVNIIRKVTNSQYHPESLITNSQYHPESHKQPISSGKSHYKLPISTGKSHYTQSISSFQVLQ
ncbi:hypothetical protein RRG08_011420 [Elysia crispata]|uniref:Uncharacterized protein n=1 Tax=Elysia crispata TaxID=231223 RepID=A0AAE1AFT0_9GAST|nr:hypothetical protein RRG08_011420 [Elysia crispata]